MIKVPIKYTREYTIAGWGKHDRIVQSLQRNDTFYELQLLNYIRSLNITGIYVDVGANIGNHSVFFAGECPSKHVVAIEAYKPLSRICEWNLKTNIRTKKWKVINVAVANNNKRADFWVSDNINMGRSRIALPGKRQIDFGLPEKKAIKVPCQKLDVILKPYRSISFIKLDIEGAEMNALKSGMTIIKKYKPVIASECSIGYLEKPNREKQEITDLLEPLGYKMICGAFGSSVGPVYIWSTK